ncbi:Pimeloyl-ACP methyl ester carboxylesterase [Paramicrobacterium humi]|uniref:Pimeloyl-ACP methyl ester carboxylesterase n=1 Tax=Paramicrobacterium humi TaxID=640635 RepID=A0A1H4PHY4_9MICO|nr:alpha/beta hydrolase [Microbacterium humi]SEC06898.1 Pimeloyl-ACP methyl ester carboxylesterase [Microbacterium humi]
MSTLLDGIASRTVTTQRLTSNVLERERDAGSDAPVVVFIHGNVSSSLFWQPFMLALPETVRPIAIDLRGFGDSDVRPVDATRGLGDFSDDIAEVLAALDIEAAHFYGWSMGGGIVMQYMLEHAEDDACRVLSATLQSPVSPYGFGGTDAEGRILNGAAGSGGGGGNPDFIAALNAGDTGDGPASPRTVFRTTYVAPGYASEHEDLWVESMLSTATGVDNYPGDAVECEAWPGFAPGERGILNTMTPDHLNTAGIADLPTKPPVLWVHGELDAIVGDHSGFDFNVLGEMGVIPGWPGSDTAPAQPMVSQTRRVLERYRAAGGEVAELLLPNCGHSPHLEHPDAVREALLDLIDSSSQPDPTTGP